MHGTDLGRSSAYLAPPVQPPKCELHDLFPSRTSDSAMREDSHDLGVPAAGMSQAPAFPGEVFPEALSPSMRSVEAVISEIAHSPVPVLLIGEHGTGKEAIARRIHQDSGFPVEQFEVKDCRAISLETLDASSLNGTTTLYLAEVGELSPDGQKKALDLLSAPKANGSQPKAVRLICGSSRDLEPLVRTGMFREDLYYRLSGVCLRIPPLRQRREDVPHLIAFFLKRYSTAFHRPAPVLSPITLELFEGYSWPGNLSELESAVCAIVAVGDESVAMGGLRSMLTRSNGNQQQRTSLKEAARAASREAERELILKVLTRTRWNRRRAAQELQISYKALLYKLKQIGCEEYGAS